MNIFSIIAAFGGGLVGAYVGAVPAFIMTGVFALIGSLGYAAGVPAIGDFAQGVMAFGPFLSPAVAFGGGVAAAAYAGRKGKLASGADVTSSLNGLACPDVLLVGGAFGVIGWVIQWLIGKLPAAIATDAPGFGVLTIGIIARLVFGKTGLLGKYTGSGKRRYISQGGAMTTNLVLGLGLGILVSGIAAMNAGNPNVINNLPVVMFGFAAITLAFSVMGLATPAVHHIVLPAGLGAQAGLMLSSGAPAGALLGIVFGVAGAVLGDFFGCTVNSYNDSHIDPPACTICLLTCVASLLKFVAA